MGGHRYVGERMRGKGGKHPCPAVLQPAILLLRIPILHVRAVEDGSDGSNGMPALHPASHIRLDPYLPSVAVPEGKIV